MKLQQIESMICEVKSVENGMATITLCMPQEFVSGFVALLASLAGLFRGLGWKIKTNIDAIHQREQVRLQGAASRMAKFDESVMQSYGDFILKGYSPKDSIKLTVKAVSYVYEFSSYDIVKNILSKNKLLKNTGFYSSKPTEINTEI